MGVGICLITAYLLFPEALSNSSESPTNIIEVDIICTYHIEIEAPFGYQTHPGMLSEQNISFLFILLSARLRRALSPVSINSTAALGPPLAALPSQCPTPSSFPSVCTDPWGPRLPPGARHGPTSINISAGLRWWAERLSQNTSEPSDISEKVLGMDILMGNGF